MPGPKSEPAAKTADGRIVLGKTELKRQQLKSGQRMTGHDWAKVTTLRMDTK